VTATMDPQRRAPAPPGPPDATLPPAGGGPGGPGGPGDGIETRPSARRPGDALSLVLSEVLLGLVGVVTLLGLVRLYDGPGYLRSALTALVVSHLLAAACRRLGWHLGVAAVVSAVGLAVVVSMLLYRDTTWWGLPTATTWDVALADLREAWHEFGEVKAPAEQLPGFLVATAVAAWVGAFLADTLAFRFAAVVEPLLPAGSLFVFSSALAADRYRLPSALAFLVAAMAFTLAQRGLLTERTPGWLAAGRRSSAAVLLRAGAVLGVAAAALAVVVGPLLPGAGKEALVDAYDGGGSGSRVTLSPLVDIRGRLTNQSDVEAFRVMSDTPAYWRLTALDEFDGEIWSSSNRITPVDGALPGAGSAFGQVVEQHITVSGLDVIWLPAAYRPVFIRGGQDVSYDRESGSLLTGEDSASGQTYTVQSLVPTLDPTILATVPPTIPGDIAARYLELPRDFPDELRDLAAQITFDATTGYHRARALQDWFRANFTYSLDVRAGHDEDAILAFIEARQGYCEQFAGTFAALARSVGLPARVAVGFTPGEQGDDGAYVVKGRNAHAWPEVWFAGVGWVPFEPTPQRGIPGAEPYTGVEPQQAVETPTTAPGTATTAPPDTLLPGEEIIPGLEELAPDLGEVTGPEAVEDTSSPWPGRLATVAGVLLAVVGTLVLLGPGRRQWSRVRRRRQASTAAEHVLASWAELEDAFWRAGVPRRATETPEEYARRAASATRVDVGAARQAAAHATAAQYGEPFLSPDAVDASAAAVARVEAGLREGLAWTVRVRSLVDPRSVRPVAVRRQVREAEHRAHR